jgi:hypothetical protein
MGPLLLASMGTPAFLAFYFGAAISSSIGSLIVKVLRGKYMMGSIGASGAIFAILAAGILLMGDEARVGILFVPGINFDPRIFFPMYLAGEVIFNLVQRKVSLDTAGHVTGALFGFLVMKLLLMQEHHQRPRFVSVNNRTYHYSGEVVQFKRHGRGVLTTPLWTYDGEFKYDQFHGRGKLDVPNTAVYAGQFEEGRFHGRGKLSTYIPDNRGVKRWSTVEGQFKDGKLVQ